MAVDKNRQVIEYGRKKGVKNIYIGGMDKFIEERNPYDIIHGGFLATKPKLEFISWLCEVYKGKNIDNVLVLFPLSNSLDKSLDYFYRINIKFKQNVPCEYSEKELMSVRYEKQMSFQQSYEDYNRGISEDYDNSRVPVGMSKIIKELKKLEQVNGRKLDILDAGCGTGIYYDPSLPYCRKYTGIDTSREMIKLFQKRLRKQDNVKIGSISNIHERTNSFDVILCNSVIHHLSSTELKQFIKECSRVLRPGGLLLLTTTTKEQNVKSWWWNWVIPHTVLKASKKMPMAKASDSKFLNLFKDDAFKLEGEYVLHGETFQSDIWNFTWTFFRFI